jgi:hypothetical protein
MTTLTTTTTECTLDQARDALETWVRSTRWKRRGLSRALVIDAFEHSGAEHVIFQSFVEGRGTVETHEPYRGGDVDGPERGSAPDAWQISVATPAMWSDTRGSYEVPHTAVVRTCHGCGGRGEVRCGTCGGDGRVSCSSCGGSGSVTTTTTTTSTDANGNTSSSTYMTTSSCTWCSGSGTVQCSHCSGSGRVTCGTCSGACNLKHYRRLDVGFRTHTTEKILEKTDLPDHLVATVTGTLELAEEDERIEPKAGGGGPFRGATRVTEEVNAAANELIAAHVFEGQKLHRQKLVVRGVPVHEARYRWGKKTRRFWVYGLERAIHAPDFPISRHRVASLIGAIALVVAIVAVVVTYAQSR